MNKNTPLVTAILGAVLLVLQQVVGQPTVDWKVVGLAALVAVLGVVSTFLKGKGASFWGALGTVGFTFYTVWQSGSFTWNEFFLAAAISVIMVFTPTAIPEPDVK